MRLLIVGSTAPGSLEVSYHRAFEHQEDVQVSTFDVRGVRTGVLARNSPARIIHNRYTYSFHARRTGRALISFFRKQLTQFDAVLVFKGMEISPDVIERCRASQPRAIWVNINPDDPFNRASIGSTNTNVVDSIPLFDVYCIWSHALVDAVRQCGCEHVQYLPFGYDADTHAPPAELLRPSDTRVVFVGSWDAERETVLQSLVGMDLRIFGHAWDRMSSRSPMLRYVVARPLFGAELAREYAEAAVCLNLLRPQNVGAHNMRTFEIPAMGGLMLTTRSAEQQAFFPENIASLMYADACELREKVVRIVADRSLAQRIRTRGSELVQDHTYVKRARTVRTFIDGVMRQRA